MNPGVERGQADDPATVAQRPARVLDQEERPARVDRHEPVVVVLGEVLDHGGRAGGRVADDDVQPAQSLLRHGAQAPQVSQAPLIGPDGEGPAAGVGDLADHAVRGGLVLHEAEYDRGAVTGQPFHDRPAYTS
jgi:hypothetical protein